MWVVGAREAGESRTTRLGKMAAVEHERFAFEVEWLDHNVGTKRKYQLMYYTANDTIEMYDIKNRRTFLKRCYYPGVKLEHLYLNAKVTVFSRQLEVVAYADEFTKRHLSSQQEKTLAVVKPDGLASLGNTLDAIYNAGLRISKMQTSEVAAVVEQPYLAECLGLGSQPAGRVVGIEVVGANAIETLLQLCSSGSSVYASPSSEVALKDVEVFFSGVSPMSSTPVGKPDSRYTCCLIKPHAVQDGNVGKIVSAIQSTGDCSVSLIGLYNLEREDAAEFYEVHRGVVLEYGSMVDELTSNSFIAIMIEGSEDVVEQFRSVCGPPDPELAVILRPTSLRAQFGIDKVRNAVHCTDLKEDGPLEANYFFNVLLA